MLLWPLLVLSTCLRLCLAEDGSGSSSDGKARKFHVVNNTFMRDGEPTVVRAGNMDYSRVVPEYHKDRLQRMKALGLNTVALYIPWNYHEVAEGQYEHLELATQYLEEIQSEGMMAILRPGPFICGEWDFGGFPPYLLTKPKIQFRTFDLQYLAAVGRWFDKLLPVLKPYLYNNGGPIVIVQVENEYGMWGNVQTNPDNARYMHHMLDLLQKHLGEDVVYSTVDGFWGGVPALGRGSPWKHNPRVLATLDGPTDAKYLRKSFPKLSAFQAPGMKVKMVSELWVGWFTIWTQDEPSARNSEDIKEGMQVMVNQKASFSMYMAHGGTTFGMNTGANWKPELPGSYEPQITSYDYGAPISEAGHHGYGEDGGDLFEVIRDALTQGYGEMPPEPALKPVAAYGTVSLTEVAGIFDNLDAISMLHRDLPSATEFPTMEPLGQYHGIMVLQLKDQSFDAFNLTIHPDDVRDRVQVFADEKEIGIAYRGWKINVSMEIPKGNSMHLVVENMGHVDYAYGMMIDHKGWVVEPPVAGDWTLYAIPLNPEDLTKLKFVTTTPDTVKGPTFRQGFFDVEAGKLADTWLDTAGLFKGLAWVNGHALGRYWETAGPQHTLYIPAPYLKEGSNELIILELHKVPAQTVTLVDAPRWSHGKKKKHPHHHHHHHHSKKDEDGDADADVDAAAARRAAYVDFSEEDVDVSSMGAATINV